MIEEGNQRGYLTKERKASMPRTYLSDDQVAKIRQLSQLGVSSRKIAEQFNVSQSYVTKLARNISRASEEFAQQQEATQKKIEELLRPIAGSVKAAEETYQSIAKGVERVHVAHSLPR